jgi:hypothetical protein
MTKHVAPVIYCRLGTQAESRAPGRYAIHEDRSGGAPAGTIVPDLSKKISANILHLSLLEGVYIPNLVASPLIVNEVYAELIYNRTKETIGGRTM